MLLQTLRMMPPPLLLRGDPAKRVLGNRVDVYTFRNEMYAYYCLLMFVFFGRYACELMSCIGTKPTPPLLDWFGFLFFATANSSFPHFMSSVFNATLVQFF
mmetsp:Transcript_6056/g.14739  ORF Transcript_6056/g.14739 Transcript_6056/m.14739 type:complete len:101 (-) Transcript_6056:2598-2900(-)